MRMRSGEPNRGPLNSTWQSRRKDAETFSHPLLKHRPLERRQQAHPSHSHKEISVAGQQLGLKLEEHPDAERETQQPRKAWLLLFQAPRPGRRQEWPQGRERFGTASSLVCP